MEKTLPLHATGKEHHQHQQWRASLDALWASHKIPIILLYYGLASSTLIVINKLAVHTVRAPVFILAAQLLFAAGVVRGSAAVGLVEVEPLRWSLVKPFTLIILGFLGTLYSNIKVLSYSNVETFITFRSSTPLVLSIFDYLLLGRELPGRRSVFSLLLLLASCAGYTYYDDGFKLEAYGWLCVWFVFFTFEACYVKFMCDTVKMSNWGRVWYTNILAGVLLAAIFPFCSHEHVALAAAGFTTPQLLTLALSCTVGVAMSHAGYLMRSNVSATAGVVCGVVCKILSVLINLMLWDQHATPVQLLFLAVGLGGGCLFRQAPLRASTQAAAGKHPATPCSNSEEEEGLIKVFEGQQTSCGSDSEDGGSSSSSSGGGGSSSRDASLRRSMPR